VQLRGTAIGYLGSFQTLGVHSHGAFYLAPLGQPWLLSTVWQYVHIYIYIYCSQSRIEASWSASHNEYVYISLPLPKHSTLCKERIALPSTCGHVFAMRSTPARFDSAPRALMRLIQTVPTSVMIGYTF